MKLLLAITLLFSSATAIGDARESRPAELCSVSAQYAMRVAAQRDSGASLQSILTEVDARTSDPKIRAVLNDLASRIYKSTITPQMAYSKFMNSCLPTSAKPEFPTSIFQRSLPPENTSDGCIARISASINSKWNSDSKYSGLSAMLSLQTNPSGEVISATTTKSSGSSDFDRAAENAITKSSPFKCIPLLEKELYESRFRTFKIMFRPER